MRTEHVKTAQPICWRCGATLLYFGQIACVECHYVQHQSKGAP